MKPTAKQINEVPMHIVLDRCRKSDDPYVKQLVRRVEEQDALLFDIATHKYPTNNTKAEAAGR